MKRYLKLIIILCCFINLIGCTNNKENENDTSKDKKEEVNYQGQIEKFKFLVRDEVFLLTLDDGNQILVNGDGKIKSPKNLKSDYLNVEYDSSYGNIDKTSGVVYDLFGNNVTDRFINDKEHEIVLGVCSTNKKDIICILKNNETPTSTEYVLYGYDEEGTQLFAISSEDSIIKQKGFSENFKNISSISSSGDCICNVIYSPTKEGLFAVNVDTGEIVESDTHFSNGIGVVTKLNDKKIVDIHGNVIKDLNNIDLGTIHNYNDGLFFSNKTKCFYDKNFNKKIDLSQYDIVHWSNEDGEDYSFNDGFCSVEVFNENKTSFYGLIDTNGNWIIELTNELKGRPIIKKINDKYIEVEDKAYNIKEKYYDTFPLEITELGDNEYVILSGKYYYLTKNKEFKLYDFEKNEIKEIVFK